MMLGRPLLSSSSSSGGGFSPSTRLVCANGGILVSTAVAPSTGGACSVRAPRCPWRRCSSRCFCAATAAGLGGGSSGPRRPQAVSAKTRRLAARRERPQTRTGRIIEDLGLSPHHTGRASRRRDLGNSSAPGRVLPATRILRSAGEAWLRRDPEHRVAVLLPGQRELD